MKLLQLDPTAGETARLIQADPTRPLRVADPMDPRCGGPELDGAEERTRQILDPTDPACGDTPPVHRA